MTSQYVWELVGGDVILDLCNTRSWRCDPSRDIERLASVASYAEWRSVVHRVHAVDLAPIDDEQELEQLRHLRDTVISVLDAQQDVSPSPADIGELCRLWIDAASRHRPQPELPLRWTAAADARTGARDELTFRAVDFLRGDLGRIRRCGLSECGWYFLDTTRNHSRRWCTPNECGNRHRVRAYTSKHRSRPS